MRILGIDPGLDVTGYGVVEGTVRSTVVIEAGIIRSSSKDHLAQRLKSIHSQLSRLIDQTSPDVCVVEKLYSHYKHPMTAILMGHARGVVLHSCSQKDLETVDYPAKTVKRAVTGNGNASKMQVQRVINRFLNLSDDARPVDVTDALALCLTHLHHSNKNKEVVRV
ncbi:MAG: crossover junction endodeoxyribonuclease RuvC [Candidatus Omnitrophica bacterium]|nr:crossover junction endodeoxyribonuclease RuvC [Candidatus Omnitrophota bacterium]